MYKHKTVTLCLVLITLLLLVGQAVYAATPITVYGDALDSGWENWSWNTTLNFAAASPIHGGSKSLSVSYSAAWAGVYLHAKGAIAAGYDTLRFWIYPSTNNQSFTVALYNTGNAQVDSISIQPAANTWTQVNYSLVNFGSSSNLGGLVWQDNTGSVQPIFYLDDIQLVTVGGGGGGGTPTAGPTLAVDATAGQHAISPYIYGLNFADTTLAADISLPVNRWGGNSTTRYNFNYDTHSTAMDWYFENIPDDNPHPENLPNGSGADNFVSANRARGTDTLLTIPMIGWTPKSRAYACGFSVAKYGAQEDSDIYRLDCGNGVHTNGTLVTGNDPTDTSVAIGPAFVQSWMQHLSGQFGTANSGGVRFYNLDNEPMLWNSTHRDVHPTPVSYDELRDRTYQYASAIKVTDANAKTLGPAEWGWTGYFYSALDMAAGGSWWNNPVDRNAHGGTELTAWYLSQMKLYEQNNGVRILDYLDLHYYPAADGVTLSPAGSATTQALRLNTTRSLWDPTYVDESWINEPVKLLPRMHDWVNANYPGTKLAISEYNFGGLEHINGAVTQADVLGIFGREQLDLATLWDPPTATEPGAYAFRMYRNYNGQGGKFGENGVEATSSDQSKLSIYAAVRGSDGALTIMVINKSTGGLTSNLTVSHFSGGLAQVYRYSNTDLAQILRGADLPVSGGVISTTYPAQSITLLVIPTDGVYVTPTPVPTISPANVAPQRNYFTVAQPMLTWNQVSWAVRYDVQVASDAAFSNPVTVDAGNVLSLTWPFALSNGIHYWRVRACSAPATCAGWSLGDGFTINHPS